MLPVDRSGLPTDPAALKTEPGWRGTADPGAYLAGTSGPSLSSATSAPLGEQEEPLSTMTHDAKEGTRVAECRWVRMPFALVERAFAADAIGLLGAGHPSEGRRILLDLTTHVTPAGFTLGTEVEITVGETVRVAGPIPSIRIPMNWHATRREDLYPVMNGHLEAFPATPDATELAIVGTYVPPLGALGTFIDHTVMHRIAADVIVELLESIVRELKSRMPVDDAQPGTRTDA